MSGFLQHLETQSLISCRPIHAKPSAILRSGWGTDYFGTFWNLYKMSTNKNILKLASSRPFQTKKAILVNENWGIFALKLAAKSSPLDNGSLNYSENLRSTLCFWRFITHGKYDKITLFLNPSFEAIIFQKKSQIIVIIYLTRDWNTIWWFYLNNSCSLFLGNKWKYFWQQLYKNQAKDERWKDYLIELIDDWMNFKIHIL